MAARPFGLLIAISVGWVATIEPAQATLVTYNFSGTVTTLLGVPIAGFPHAPAVDDQIGGSYTIDPGTPASGLSTPSDASFYGAVKEFNIDGFNIDSIVAQGALGTSDQVYVHDDFAFQSHDVYHVSEFGYSSDYRYGFRTDAIFWNQHVAELTPDPSDLSLLSDDFTPPYAAFFEFDILDGLNSLDPILVISGHIDEVEFAPILPEPGSLPLFCGSFVAFVLGRRAMRHAHADYRLGKHG